VNPSRKMVACIDGASRKPSGSRRRRCGSGVSPGDDTAVACRAGADDHVKSGHACRPLCAPVRDRMTIVSRDEPADRASRSRPCNLNGGHHNLLSELSWRRLAR
jgi:hypothetical protein